MIKSDKDISKEPVIIHFQCNKCDKMASLPEKVWQKRGSICSSCWNQNYKLGEEIDYA